LWDFDIWSAGIFYLLVYFVWLFYIALLFLTTSHYVTDLLYRAFIKRLAKIEGMTTQGKPSGKPTGKSSDKPSKGSSVPVLSNGRLAQLAASHQLVDSTRDMTAHFHRIPNAEEINEQHPKVTAFMLAAVSLIIRATAKVRAYGLERVPETGPFIAACTHVTEFDVLVPTAGLFHMGRRPRFMAKAELSHVPFIGWALRQVGMQSVRRGKGMAQSIEEESIRIVTDGRPLTIWPEGTLTRDPLKWTMSLKVGMAEIALVSSVRLGKTVPLFPIAVWGMASVRHLWPWPRKNVVMGVGEAVDYSDLLADSSSWVGGQPPKEVVELLTDRVREQMDALMAEIRGEEPPAEGYWDYRAQARKPRTR
jgi:1-acyl-sn-glycerol-3-phosphate acyltransferase